ncbi:Vacuolar membrane amino acid uptake transporter fnx2 [Apiospora aurea]|uniref:Vacuolar membrane amino acid uptake transporter fnx2 n=1 Tax=Apiospora aurea TaxID=335848 RepID=A0ABR1QTA9_9PEZI
MRPQMALNSPFKPGETTSLLSGENRHCDVEQAVDVYKGQADHASSNASRKQQLSSSAVLKVVLVLLVGTFTSNGDSSLVLATHPTIASEFNCLSASTWLFVSFSLAGAATQTVYGKLSDIYGRRLLLIVAYALFAIGCALIGTGHSMGMVILGRIISGCGGSAMNVLGILIITAAWQSGINLAATTGRSLGGPVGGWLADTVGWRWSFMGQVPLFILAIGLCMVWLPRATVATDATPADSSKLATESAAPKSPWTHPLILLLVLATLAFGALFLATEACWAAEPIFPVELLKHRDVLLTYFVTAAQGGAQLGLMFAVPLYFQVTKRVSNAVAGTYLVPAVAGNAIGAIVAGIVIKRTGRYKPVLLFATLSSTLSYLLLLLRWHGRTTVWESLYIFPGGLGTGIVQTATFVAVQAAIDPAHKAAAMSGNFLVVTIGGMAGMVAVNAVTVATMTRKLGALLDGMGIAALARRQIIEKAASDIDYIDEASKTVSAAVVEAYVDGLSASHLVSLVGSLSAILATLLIREHAL